MDIGIFWTALAAVGTVLSAVIATWSFIISKKTQKEQLNSKKEINALNKQLLKLDLEERKKELAYKERENKAAIESYYTPKISIYLHTSLGGPPRFGFDIEKGESKRYRILKFLIHNHGNGVAYSFDLDISAEGNSQIEFIKAKSDIDYYNDLPYPNFQGREEIKIVGTLPLGPSVIIMIKMKWKDDYGWKEESRNYKADAIMPLSTNSGQSDPPILE